MSAQNINTSSGENTGKNSEFGGAESVEGFQPYKGLLSRMDERVAPQGTVLPEFDSTWMNRPPSTVVSAADILETEVSTGNAKSAGDNSRKPEGLHGYKRYYSIAAMLFMALAAGALYFQESMRLGSEAHEVLRLKNGAIIRGIVLERVGNKLTVQTPDGIFRINANEGAGIDYSAHNHQDAHGNELIVLKNGAIVRGEVLERIGGKLIVDTGDGSFQINSGELKAITYIAQSDHEQ